MKLSSLKPADRDFACSILDCLAGAAPSEDGRPGHWVYLDELRLGAGYDPQYALGLLRLLHALGLLELDRAARSARVSSVNGGYMLLLLSDLLAEDAPIVANWGSDELGPPNARASAFESAVNLLAALELRRLELLPDAAPVRKVEASYGLIAELRGGEHYFLLCFDRAAGAWQVPGGRYEHGDRSLRATLLRELEEELGVGPLHEPDNVRLEPLLQRVAGTRLSPSRGLLTRTVFHFFLVSLSGSLLADRPDVRWVSERELLAGRTDDGQLVSAEPLVKLLAHAEHEPALRDLAALPQLEYGHAVLHVERAQLPAPALT